MKTGSKTPPEPPTPAPAAGGASPIDPDPVDSTRSPVGDEPATAVPVSKKTIASFLHDAIGAVTEFVHDRLATSPEAQQAGLWLATDDDQAQIADPLAAVAASHGIKTVGGADTANLIAAGIGVAMYLGRNIAADLSIRLGRRRQRRAAQRAAEAPQQ